MKETIFIIERTILKVNSTGFIYNVELKSWETVYLKTDNIENLFQNLLPLSNKQLIVVNEKGIFDTMLVEISLGENYIECKPKYCNLLTNFPIG